MFCPECGNKIEEGALFCPECGTKVAKQPQQQPADSTPPQEKTASTEDSDSISGSSNQSSSPQWEEAGKEAKQIANGALSKFKNLDKTKQYGILGGIAVVILVAIIAFASPLSGNVSTDAARQAFAQSEFATNGAVSSKYTNGSAYEIKDFKIDSQEDPIAGYSSEYRQSTSAMYGTDKIRTVTFSGTIANDNFETNFVGKTDFKSINGNWTPVSSDSQEILSKDTKPIKGVDSLSLSFDPSNVSYSNFSSNLNESNGSYTSEAAANLTYSWWFATDTAKATQSFTFDPDSGWKSDNYAQTSDEKTEWLLKGKTFKFSGESNSGNLDGSITFGEATGETITADYSFDYTPTGNTNDFVTGYNSASVKGNTSGQIYRRFGNGAFNIGLKDEGNKVDIGCENYGVAKDDDSKNALSVSVSTETPYRTLRGGFKDNLIFTNRTFTEATQTNA